MLNTIDLSLTLDDETYKGELIKYQVALHALAYQVYVQQRPVVILFEGWDGSGKGGAIRRVTERIDPRGFVVHTTAAPKGDDAARHYLYRFWRRLPEAGQIAIFDQSWYGRVLYERIEAIAADGEWKRAYREINAFERQLIDACVILFKFWIHISPEEQLRRFEERSKDPLKSWKLTDNDWRNREKWSLYEEAINDMLLKTSPPNAPWTLVEGDSKQYARIKVLRTLVDGLSYELDYDPFAEGTARDKTGKKKKKKDRS